MNQKLKHLPIRFLNFFLSLPKRTVFLFLHFLDGPIYLLSQKPTNQSFANSIFYWWWELVCKILDLFGISELYETACDFYKKETRPLNGFELIMAKEIFGNSIEYDRVRIDEMAEIACKKGFLKYVSFNTINSWGTMSDSIFIHEMVHVWQYQKIGMAYIPKALKVHLTDGMSYNYGGVLALKKIKAVQGGLLDFNYEQQGDIVGDYFRIKNGMPPCWGNGTIVDLEVYEYFIQDLVSHQH